MAVIAKQQLFDHASAATDKVRAFAESVDIGGAGHGIDFSWAGVAGATIAELSDASVTLQPAVAETVLPLTALTPRTTRSYRDTDPTLRAQDDPKP